MAPRHKLTSKQLEELEAAYNAWNPSDPETESADELAARFGISKQTLYNLRRNGWRYGNRKIVRKDAEPYPETNDLEPVVRYLTEQLIEARAEIARLQAISGKS